MNRSSLRKRIKKARNEFARVGGRWRILKAEGLTENTRAVYTYVNMSRFIRRQIRLEQMDNEGLFLSTNVETFGPCNRKCSFCFNHERFEKRKLGVMEESVWYKIIDEFSSLNFAGRISPFFYGEPLLDKRIWELLAYARQKCPLSYIQVNTNGDYLNEEIVRKAIVAGIDRFLVTNYDDMEKPLLENLKAKYPFWVTYRDYTDFHIRNRGGEIFDRQEDPTNEPCYRPSSQLVVNWNGEVALCCNDFYTKHAIGNIKHAGVLETWQNKKFADFRGILEKEGGRRELEFCRNCDTEGAEKIY